MEKQKTIKSEITLSGSGLHTNHKAKITLKPGLVDSGINFIRTDLALRPVIKAHIDSLYPPSTLTRRTSIGSEACQVQTIEHLLSALAGLGIDNLNIEIDNDEVPGLDGSSQLFVDKILESGIQEQERDKKVFFVKEPILIQEGASSIMIFPSDQLKISYTMDYKHPFLKTQFFEIEVNQESFKSELASARTFCLEEEAKELQKQGLGLGANYENTLVVGQSGVIKNSLRFDNEFIRHKITDLLGDLYLLGASLKGHIVALRSGHSLNLKLVKKLIDSQPKISSAVLNLEAGKSLDIEAIMKIIPHRDPFLFVDRITHLEIGKRATGLKNVTINDYFFRGHFPGKPVMPGVLIIEAMAQVGGVMMLASEENRGKLAFFLTANNIKFRKTVVPGDQLIFEVEAGRIKSRTGQVFAKALVDGKVVVEAEFMFALADY